MSGSPSMDTQDINVQNVMTANVSWVTPDTTLPEVARRMRAEDIGSVPVVEGDRLVGMVTDRDIVLRAVVDGGDVTAIKARQVMSPGVLYCFADQSVAEVLDDMGGRQVRRLPVVSREKRLVGVVSLGDLSRAAESQSGTALKEISRPAADSRAAASMPRGEEG